MCRLATGHYNRFDVLSLRYNRRKPKSLEFIDETPVPTSKDEIAAIVRSTLTALEADEGAAANNAGQITQLRGLLTKLS